jgi:hypothetical protein
MAKDALIDRSSATSSARQWWMRLWEMMEFEE